MIPGGSDNLDTVAFDPGDDTLPPPEREKVKKLAEALQQRPQLTIEVQGRYSVDADGTALKDMSVRRQLAAELGTATGPGEKPDPIDFGSPETQEVLETLVRERLGAVELKKLEESLSKIPDEGVDNTKQDAQPVTAEDPGEFSKLLYSRLLKIEPLEESVLVELAAARGQAVVDELTADGAVAMDRVAVKDVAVVAEGEPLSAKLSLAVVGKSE